jgi:amino acid transporter
MAEEKKYGLLIVGIVGIVAIVAIMLMAGWRSSSFLNLRSSPNINNIPAEMRGGDAGANLGGQAMRVGCVNACLGAGSGGKYNGVDCTTGCNCIGDNKGYNSCWGFN